MAMTRLALRLTGYAVEFGIKIAMESINSGMVVLHRARAEDMVRATTTSKTVMEFGREVTNGKAR